jgi:hypothetical protein
LSDVSLFEEELWNTDDFSVVTVSPTILRSGVLLLSLLKLDYYWNYNFNLISVFGVINDTGLFALRFHKIYREVTESDSRLATSLTV